MKATRTAGLAGAWLAGAGLAAHAAFLNPTSVPETASFPLPALQIVASRPPRVTAGDATGGGQRPGGAPTAPEARLKPMHGAGTAAIPEELARLRLQAGGGRGADRDRRELFPNGFASLDLTFVPGDDTTSLRPELRLKLPRQVARLTAGVDAVVGPVGTAPAAGEAHARNGVADGPRRHPDRGGVPGPGEQMLPTGPVGVEVAGLGDIDFQTAPGYLLQLGAALPVAPIRIAADAAPRLTVWDWLSVQGTTVPRNITLRRPADGEAVTRGWWAGLGRGWEYSASDRDRGQKKRRPRPPESGEEESLDDEGGGPTAVSVRAGLGPAARSLAGNAMPGALTASVQPAVPESVPSTAPAAALRLWPSPGAPRTLAGSGLETRADSAEAAAVRAPVAVASDISPPFLALATGTVGSTGDVGARAGALPVAQPLAPAVGAVAPGGSLLLAGGTRSGETPAAAALPDGGVGVLAAGTVTQFYPQVASPPASVPPGGWPTAWQALPLYDAARDVQNWQPQNDFVGDATDPAAYFASNDQYVFFRLRLNVPTVTTSTFQGSVWLFIDQDNSPTHNIDYAIGWDTSGTGDQGLELLVPGTVGPNWKDVDMTDRDGSETTRAQPDFNTMPGHSTDGYVQVIDSQATTAFGDTSFVDFAISWAYLTATWFNGSTWEPVTTLNPSQTWGVAFATQYGATDNTDLSPGKTDVLGIGKALSNTRVSNGVAWATVQVPEPGTTGLLTMLALGGMWSRRPPCRAETADDRGTARRPDPEPPERGCRRSAGAGRQAARSRRAWPSRETARTASG